MNSHLKIINVLLAIVFLSQATTGIFKDALALPDDIFETLHEKGGFVLVALAALHVIFNRKWIVAQFFKKKPVVSKTSLIPKPDIRD